MYIILMINIKYLIYVKFLFKVYKETQLLLIQIQIQLQF